MRQVFIHANLITLDSLRPRADALIVDDDRIVFVGSTRDALALAGPGRTEDLGGHTVVPGFCDAHLHLYSYGAGLLRQADLTGVESVDALLERLSAHAAHYDGPWLQGRGFDDARMVGGRLPTRADLDRVSTTRPIIATRVCGHAAVVNSAALAQVTATERAAGDADSGYYTETTLSAFTGRIPALTDAEGEAAVLRAAAVALRQGVTSLGCLLDVPEQMGAYARLHRKGKLPIRVTGMPPFDATTSLHALGIGTGFGDDRLAFGGAKLFSDGSLGARTALLATPYADGDHPDNRGIRIYPPDVLKTHCADAQARGFQVVIHAIGDQAVRESLDAIEHALGPDSDNGWHRHRIEHVSLLAPDQRRRMAERKIVAVVQPQFVTSDVWTAERVGAERSAWAYPFQAMLDDGIPLALSSDCPVEPLDPFACLAAAVGRAPWSPDGGLTPEDALRSYCLGGAYALHQDDRLGSLTPGKLADFVILSADPTHLSADGLRRLRALRVFVGGRAIETLRD
jgi:predicted amidohydrolase YtcJ